MVFYGGVLFGFLTLLTYAAPTRLSIGNLLDVFAPGLALGLAIGRIGCFMAGCCWGDVCVDRAALPKVEGPVTAWQLQTFPGLSWNGFPLAVRFPKDAGAFEQHSQLGLVATNADRSLPVHPAQLYEAVLAVGLCILLNGSFRKRAWPGQVCCWLILGYAVVRFVVEFFRADNPPIYLGLTLSQVISVVL